MSQPSSDGRQQLGVDRSALLRDAVRLHLNRLASEHDAERWARAARSPTESSALAALADWGPAEDWADWGGAGDVDSSR
jgi:hypothetical protein